MLFARCLQINYVDFNLLIEWLLLSISTSISQSNIKDKINYALRIVPNSLEYKGSIVSFALIYYWQIGDMINIEKITNLFSSYLNINLKYKPWIRNFFIFINLLYNFKIENNTTYLCKNNKYYKKLYSIGESHSLTLSSLPICVFSEDYKVESLFVMGLKMHHLKEQVSNKFKDLFLKYINRLEINTSVIFTIGEIDCRPDEGIWNKYKNSNIKLQLLIEDTISEYLDFIANSIKYKELEMIIIQGIPAPNYNLSEFKKYIKDEERQIFLKMIEDINLILKKK